MNRLAFLLAPTMLSAMMQQPDPRELVQAATKAIKHYDSYQLESIVKIEMHGGVIQTNLEMPSSVSVRRPDHVRIESRSQTGTVVNIVSDGEHTWYYVSAAKEYVKRTASASPEAAVGNGGIMPKDLPDVGKSIQSVKITGEDTLTVGGEKMRCWVVETIFDKIMLINPAVVIEKGKQISWIRKSDSLSLQNTFEATLELPGVDEPVQMTQSTVTTSLRLNVSLPDSLFVFTPPANARETADWTLPGIEKPDLVGKAAPDFHATTVDGAEVAMTNLKGKVVLLHFWASWCVPCQRELPKLERLHREFAGAGLAVVGVNVGEDPSALRKFLGQTPLSYPIVPVDDSAELAAKLSVNSFPTMVLIDREGNIASYEVGERDETLLRADLEKLGIGKKAEK